MYLTHPKASGRLTALASLLGFGMKRHKVDLLQVASLLLTILSLAFAYAGLPQENARRVMLWLKPLLIVISYVAAVFFGWRSAHWFLLPRWANDTKKGLAQEREQIARDNDQNVADAARKLLLENAQHDRALLDAAILAVKPITWLLDSSTVYSFHLVFSEIVQRWNQLHPEQRINHIQERFLWPLQLINGHLLRISSIERNTPKHLQEDLFFICHEAQSIWQHFFGELQSKQATAAGWPAALHEDYTKLRETWNELLGSWNSYCDQQGLAIHLVARMPEIGSIGVSDSPNRDAERLTT